MLELLRFRKVPCPWDWACYKRASENVDLGLLEWLRLHNCPCNFPPPIEGTSYKVMPWLAPHIPHQMTMRTLQEGVCFICRALAGWHPDSRPSSTWQRLKTVFAHFMEAARWLAKQPSHLSSLGSLSSKLVHRIACQAQLEFSVPYDDLPAKLLTAASRDEAKDDTMWEENVDGDDEEVCQEVVMMEESQVGLVPDEPPSDREPQESEQLQPEHEADRLWLVGRTLSLSGSDRSDSLRDDDDDWLPDA